MWRENILRCQGLPRHARLYILEPRSLLLVAHVDCYPFWCHPQQIDPSIVVIAHPRRPLVATVFVFEHPSRGAETLCSSSRRYNKA